MRRFVPLLLLLAACKKDTPDAATEDALDPVEQQVSDWLAEMTLDEKIEQMSGSRALPDVDGTWPQPGLERLGIPELRMIDGPRGVNHFSGEATAFPVGMARGATWDPELERRVGRAIATEAVAKGANVLLAPVIEVLRHPGWGRAQETYGEDTHHIGRMGVGFIEGAQEVIMTSAKHFAVNSIEDTRFDVDVSLDERTLREIYIPQFEWAVNEAGVGSIMSAYNSVNGSFCAENAHLLTDILKEEWGFTGFVESDWLWGTNSTAASANAGLDIEMPYGQFYGDALREAVDAGEVTEETIDGAVRRVLRQKIVFDVGNPPDVGDAIESPEHIALSREVASKSMVLLKNEGGALPLDRSTLGQIAVVGEFADVANIGDAGSSRVDPSYVITPLVGLEEAAQDVTITHLPEPVDEATAASADAIVVVVGLDQEDEGEQIPTFPGGDRDSLTLRASHVALIQQMAAIHPRTIVVLEGGSAILVEEWIDEVEAVLMAWYPGMEGGHAIADILYGDTVPSGKLPLSIPRSASDLPPFDHVSLAVEYGYFHGYRHLQNQGTQARFAFGFGLSYTTFELSNLQLNDATFGAGDTLTATLDITNTGTLTGDEVVQAYVSVPNSSYERAPRDLRGFARVTVPAGETVTTTIHIRMDDLQVWDEGWVLEPGPYTVEVGSSSDAIAASAEFSID